MNKHQKQHAKDKASYAKFAKKVGNYPKFTGSHSSDDEKKLMKKWDKWFMDK